MNNIINKVVENLFLLENKSNCNIPIVYPKYRNNDNKLRISEQEAKQIFIYEVIKRKLFFSVETPTKEEYSFSGSGSRSGCIDLSVYFDNPKKQINIEFKFGNKGKNIIQKDFEKLIFEKDDGIFFHVIKNTDSNTLTNILNKYNEAINGVFNKRSVDSELTLVLVSLKDNKKFIHHTFNTKDVRKDEGYLKKYI